MMKLTEEQAAAIRADDCICFKLYGRMVCGRRRRVCPFLDPGERNGDTQERLREQIRRYRAVGIKPAFGGHSEMTAEGSE